MSAAFALCLLFSNKYQSSESFVKVHTAHALTSNNTWSTE